MGETDLRYEAELIAADFAGCGHVKPSAYQNMVQAVVEQHLAQYELDTTSMVQRGVAWVLAGATFQVQEAPKAPMAMRARTWHAKTQGAFFRRELEFVDAKTGRPVFCAATFSVVMDLEKRSILRRFDLPREVGDGNGVFLIPDARRAFPENIETAPLETRRARPSWLDEIGHVNNARYGEVAFDALSDRERERDIREFCINFHQELRAGDAFIVARGADERYTLITGAREEDGKESFAVRFAFFD